MVVEVGLGIRQEWIGVEPLSLQERGWGEGAAEAAELHVKAKAVKCKIKRFRSKVQSFHSFGASYFSLLVQRKVTKRKHTLPPRPARCAVGVRLVGGIFLQDVPVL